MSRETKRSNGGRPKGSTRYAAADAKTMSAMADLIITEAKLAPTTAMHRLEIENESVVRRIRRKWRAEGAHHLEAARGRQEARRARSTAGSGSGYDPRTAGLHLSALRGATLSDLAQQALDQFERYRYLEEQALRTTKYDGFYNRTSNGLSAYDARIQSYDTMQNRMKYCQPSSVEMLKEAAVRSTSAYDILRSEAEDCFGLSRPLSATDELIRQLRRR